MQEYSKWLKWISGYGLGIRDVPRSLITSELCFAAVKLWGPILQLIPTEFLTPELCLDAVKRDGYALEFVPVELRSFEICLAAVKRHGYALGDVPILENYEKLCWVALEHGGENLKFVKNPTIEMCRYAIQKDKWGFKYVPMKLRRRLGYSSWREDYHEDFDDRSRLPVLMALMSSLDLPLEVVLMDLLPVVGN
jgi:hypothetical protein